MKLIVSLPYGQVERLFERSIQGRNEAILYLRQLNKKHGILSYKMLDLSLKVRNK